MRKIFKFTVVLLVFSLVASVFVLNSALIQAENTVEAAFTISNSTPVLGETVTFTAASFSAQNEVTKATNEETDEVTNEVANEETDEVTNEVANEVTNEVANKEANEVTNEDPNDAASLSPQKKEAISYNWDFGDGTTASGIQVNHVFNAVNDFKVCLTVTDNNNRHHTVEKWIYVGRPQGWTEKTHKSIQGDYGVVFPEDKVLRMDIVISAENFKNMEDDLGNSDGRDPVYVPVTVKFNDYTWWNVGMRYKGNNTLSLVKEAGKHKYPFMLNFDKFEAEYPEIRGQKFYGFKELSCNNNWSDASFLLNVACSDIFRAGGVPTARGSFCRMYVDTGDGPVYWGLYSVFEQPEDQMIKTQFPNADGNMYKSTGKDADWATWNEDAFEKVTNKEVADWSDIKAAVTALNADRTDAAAWRAGLEAVFDVKTFLRWLAINTVIVNTEINSTAAQNYYLYQNQADKGRLVWIPWDFNMSLSTTAVGTSDDGDPGGMPGAVANDATVLDNETSPTEITDPGKTDGEASSLVANKTANWSLIRLVTADPVYGKIYKRELQKALLGCFDAATITAKIRRMHEMIRPYVVGEEGENTAYSYLTNGETEFDQALNDLLTHIRNQQVAVKGLLGLNTPVATIIPKMIATSGHNSDVQDLNQVITKPSSSKPQNGAGFLNQSIVNPNKKLISKKGMMNLKKGVALVLGIGLLLGMIAFGARACWRSNGSKHQSTKKTEIPRRHRPQMGNWEQEESISINGEDKWPA